MSILQSNAGILHLDYSLYDGMDSNGKLAVNSLICDKSYTLPAGIGTSDEMQTLLLATSEFVNYYNEICLITSFNSLSSREEFNKWIQKNSLLVGLEADAKLYTWYQNQSGTEEYIEHITAIDDVSSISEIREQMYYCALLSAIENSHYTTTKNIVESFPTIFNVDSAKLRVLTSAKQAEIYSLVTGVFYKTPAEFVTVFNNKIKSYAQEGGSFVSPSGGVGGSSATGENYSDIVKLVDGEIKVFNDIVDVSWASKAIMELYNRGIINGKTDGIFAPNDNVTRAEFVKMLVMVKGIELEETSTQMFADTPKNEWYSTYVDAAYREGIVLGSDNGHFYPNLEITRQDMAVMLYRVSKVSERDTGRFADNAQISDYAVSAVNTLKAINILNGSGNNMFYPKAFATRAEAAQMIYKALDILTVN